MLGPMEDRERRWLGALLVLGTMTVAVILIGQVAAIVSYFNDIILIFFLAWLLAFILSPVPTTVERWVPSLPRIIVVVVTYLVLLVGLRLDLLSSARTVLDAAASFGGTLVGPLTDLALASLSIVGNLVLVLVFSLYIVMDRDRMLDFVGRLVPPRYGAEFRLLRTSMARSFGGFLRGQAILGLVYGAGAVVTHVLLGLEFTGASAVLSGVLMAVPFFGPFFAWAPPVIVGILTAPDQVGLTLAIMGLALLAEMNVMQPRIMADTVGIHPLVVLASVIIGAKLAGIPGAIFSVPIAAVLSSFFFYYLNRSALAAGDVATRAARVVEAREGRPIRVPTPPTAADEIGGGFEPPQAPQPGT